MKSYSFTGKGTIVKSSQKLQLEKKIVSRFQKKKKNLSTKLQTIYSKFEIFIKYSNEKSPKFKCILIN